MASSAKFYMDVYTYKSTHKGGLVKLNVSHVDNALSAAWLHSMQACYERAHPAGIAKGIPGAIEDFYHLFVAGSTVGKQKNYCNASTSSRAGSRLHSTLGL